MSLTPRSEEVKLLGFHFIGKKSVQYLVNISKEVRRKREEKAKYERGRNTRMASTGTNI